MSFEHKVFYIWWGLSDKKIKASKKFRSKLPPIGDTKNMYPSTWWF